MRRISIYVAVAIIAAIVATLTASVLYPLLVFRERPGFELVSASIFYGLRPAVRGLVLAVPAGILFAVLRRRLGAGVFVLLASVMAAILGAVLGLWAIGDSPHVSSAMAAKLLAVTWALAGGAAALLARRSPT